MTSNPMAPVIQAKTDMMGWWRHDFPWDETEEHILSMYIHRDAARAWQALRDWLEGDAEVWNAHLETACARIRALDVQEGGNHYKEMAIQPVEYIMANGIGFVEGSVIKYVSRWRAKGGVQDLRKARHFLDLLIEAQQP